MYSEELAGRLRERLGSVNRVTEREMFGGVSFMIAGNMCCGVLGEDLVVRIDPTLHHDALTRPNVSEFVMGGRSSRGMIRVGPAGVDDDDELALWVRLGIAHATSLPPKEAGAKKGAPAKKRAPAKRKAPAARKAEKAAKKAPAAKRKAAPAKKRTAPVKRQKAPAKKKTAPVKRQKAPAKKKKAAVTKKTAVKKKTVVKKKAAKAVRRRR